MCAQADPYTVSTFRLVKNFDDNFDDVNSLDISKDGSIVVSGADDESLHVYNVTSGKLQNTVMSRKYGVDLVRFANVNTKVICASKNSWDQSLRYLSLEANSYIRYFPGHRDRVASLSVSTSDETFISASIDGTVRLWDFRSASGQGLLRRKGSTVASFDPAGLCFAIASSTNLIALFDKRKYTTGPFTTFEVDTNPFEWTSIEFSFDGKLLLALGGDCCFLLDAFSGRLLQELRGASPLLTVSFSPDAQYVVGGCIDGTVLLWELSTARLLTSIQSRRSSGSIHAIKWNPVSFVLATGSDQVSFWTPAARPSKRD